MKFTDALATSVNTSQNPALHIKNSKGSTTAIINKQYTSQLIDAHNVNRKINIKRNRKSLVSQNSGSGPDREKKQATHWQESLREEIH